jgi:endonuclease III
MMHTRSNIGQGKELRHKMAVVERRLAKLFVVPERPRRSSPLESMVHTILSQNTNDTNSGRAFRSLRKSFPRWEMLLDAPASKIARAIRVGGLANQKSRNIKDFLKWVRRTYGRLNLDAMHKMTPAEAIETFTTLKGIGLKTVYVTLLFACGRDVFPVDTHIYRISKRLGIAPEKASRDKVTELMQPLVPRGKALALHINLIELGRRICAAREPKCYQCPLTDVCLYPEKNMGPAGKVC